MRLEEMAVSGCWATISSVCPTLPTSSGHTVRVIRFIHACKRVSFSTCCLPENSGRRLLIKGSGKTLTEQGVREELEVLGIPVQSVLQFC